MATKMKKNAKAIRPTKVKTAQPRSRSARASRPVASRVKRRQKILLAKLLRGYGIALVALAILTGLGLAKATLFAPVGAAASSLSVSGSKLINGAGQPVQLRGAMIESSFAYYKPYINQNQDPLIVLNSKTFQSMQSEGMNVIRINMSQWIEQADDSTTGTGQYLTRLDTAIANANQAGLYVVLDFHSDGQSGAVAPYTDGMLHKTSEAWWVKVATRYKGNGMVLFDLVNEPKYPNWQEWEHGDGNDIVGLLDVTQAIRKAGVNNIVVLEPGQAAGSQLSGWQGFTVSDIADKNIIVSKHDYSEVPTGYFNSNPTQFWEKDWGPFLNVRPLFYGEWALLPHPNYPVFCKGTNSSNADAVVNAFLNYMQAIGASWTAWSYTPTHMIDSWANLQPTTMQTGAPWTCPVPDNSTGQYPGMGADVKAFLTANPNPGSGHLQQVIAKGDAMIASRLQGLQTLAQLAAGSKKLSSSDKATLQSEITKEVNGLNSAKAKLDKETSVSAAQADVAALATEYKVYGFLSPKIHIVSSADWQQVVEGNLALLASKLQGRIGHNQQLQTVLDDMDKNITKAKAGSSSVETAVLPLQDSDFVHNPKLFVNYVSSLQQAQAENQTAMTDARTIIDTLKAQSCDHTGVSGSNGNYSFAQLAVDSGGNVVDAKNPTCKIHLLGTNEGWWTAETTGDPASAKATFDFMQQHLHYNIIRVAYNSRWYIDNPNDPSYGKPFRSALDDFITMAKQHGLYVELDLDSQFVLPPCDPSTPHCSKPNQGSLDWDTKGNRYYQDMNGEELSAYQPTALTSLKEIATAYKNDPAILFDVWNEPATSETNMPMPGSNPPARGPISEDTFFKDMQDRVAQVASVTQDHITVVYIRALNDIQNNHYPVFTEKNIMYDTHMYNPIKDGGASLTGNINFAHSNHQAFIVGEWGGAPGQPDPNVLLPLLRTNNAGDTYFATGNLYDGSKKNFPSDLNAIGQAVRAQYNTTFSQ